MAELAAVWLSVVPDTSRIAPGIRRAMSGQSANVRIDADENTARQSGQRAGRAAGEGAAQGAAGASSRLTSALTKGLKVGAVAAGAGIATVLTGALTSGFSRLTAIDDARFKLKALGNSAQDVDKIMQSATAAVKGTAFGLDQAANTAASAVAAGIKPGQQLEKYLGMTADAAAVAGVSMADMGSIMNKVQTNGRAMTDDLQQLGDRGLPIFQWIAKEAGVSAGAVADMASDGAISAEMFQAAIRNNIGGAAKTMGESITGSMANAKAALARFGAELAKPLMAGLTAALPVITSFLDDLTKKVAPAFQVVKSALATVGEAVVSVGAAFSAAAGFVRDNSTVFGALAAVIGGALLPAIVTLGVQYAVGTVRAVAWVAALYAQNIATKAAAAGQWLLNAALTANPIGIVIAAIAGLVAGLVFFFTKTETGRKLWDKIWTGIKSVTSSVVSWFTGTAWPALQGVFQSIGQVATWLWQNVMLPAWNGIKAAIGIAWAGIQVYFNIWKTAIQAVGTVVLWLWNNVVTPAFTAIGQVISVWWAAVQVVWELFKLSLRVVGGVITWLWNTVAVPAFQGIQAAASAFWGVVQPIWNLFKAGIDLVGNAILWLWNNVAVPAFSGVQTAATTMWSGVEKIWGLFKKGLDLVVTAGTAFKDGLVGAFNAVKSAVESVWNKISPILSKIQDGLSKVNSFVGKIPGFSGGGLVPGFAGGGYTGPGGKNTPAGVVHAGEFVINKAATKKLQNAFPGVLAFMNGTGTLPGYSGGGLVTGSSQLKDIISQKFGISDIGGYRAADGYNEHSTGRALDVMIGNDMAKGDAVKDFAIANASAIDLKWAIWKQRLWYPDGSSQAMEDRGSPTQNHMDHVHIFSGPGITDGLKGALSGGSGGTAPRVADDTASGFTEPTSFPSTGGGRSGGSKSTAAAAKKVTSAKNQATQAKQAIDDKEFALEQAKLRRKELDGKKNVSESSRRQADYAITKAERELNDAKAKYQQALADVETAQNNLDTVGLNGDPDTKNGDDKSEKTTGDPKELGKIIGGGILETFGFDGSVFDNPFEWDGIKFLTSFFGKGGTGGFGTLASVFAPSGKTTTQAGENILSEGAGGNILTGIGQIAATAANPTGGQAQPAKDLSINFNGNVGMDPKTVFDATQKKQNERTRTYAIAGRP